MKMTHTAKTRWLSCILCVVLLAAMALTAIGCNDTPDQITDGTAAVTDTAAVTETAAATESDTEEAKETAPGAGTADDPILRGQGATAFTFTVTFADGKEKVFEIHTDKKTVGEALQELGLIAGEESEYGLYVKVVDGVTADYDVDKSYWAFYINGEYGMTGVDSTNITAGATYAFKIQK